MSYSLAIWILVLPFGAFLITGLANNHLKARISGAISIGAMLGSTLLAYLIAYKYFMLNPEEMFLPVEIEMFTWLQLSEHMVIEMGLLLDPISVMMLVVITTVSLMVHLYSTGYMKDDEGYARYFTFLSLFTFSMLGLVVATNLIQIYIFWELVGVSSYLLIGHYYQKPEAVAAAKKAFVVTRFADFGFLIGILLLSYHTGTFDFSAITDPGGVAINQPMGGTFLGLSTLSWALILMFMGGAGKSAMFPFHIWLPDAMEGPTPVSALIHAATMVVAGVYLIARLFPVFVLAAPDALQVVAFIGAFTSLFAAVIAVTQTDIKKVLAYSTVSQIGYMMLALGVSGYGGVNGLGFTASLFHLFTHAFFKALLFLGAGSIIHAVHSSEMKDMGGLRKYMPATHLTFLIACLAISGIPPLSGFFSKDEILAAAYASGFGYFLVEYLVAGITAFYMFRLYFKIFWGKSQSYHNVRESPTSMTIPMIVLAIGAAAAGFIPFNRFVTTDGAPFEIQLHWSIAVASAAIGLVGILVALYLYKRETDRSKKIAESFGTFTRIVQHKFYVDEIYVFITKNIIFQLISKPIAWFDRHIVDGTMNLIGNSTVFVSGNIKRFQSGNIHQYAFVFLTGILIAVFMYLYLEKT